MTTIHAIERTDDGGSVVRISVLPGKAYGSGAVQKPRIEVSVGGVRTGFGGVVRRGPTAYLDYLAVSSASATRLALTDAEADAIETVAAAQAVPAVRVPDPDTGGHYADLLVNGDASGRAFAARKLGLTRKAAR